MARIFLTGDSFSDQLRSHPDNRQWFNKLADRLNMTLVNHSAWGVAQDWSMFWIIDQMHEISSEDQLIWVLTHPSRFWFYLDNEQYTQSWQLHGMSQLTDAAKRENKITLTKGQIDAGRLYADHIQRPELDTQMLFQRMATLSLVAERKGWKPPIILRAFDQYVPFEELFPNLRFSVGALDSIATAEESNLKPFDYFKGIDPRYNHMCLSNHAILADLLADSITNNTSIDLTVRNWVTGQVTHENMREDSWVDAEFSRSEFERMKETHAKQGFWNLIKKPLSGLV